MVAGDRSASRGAGSRSPSRGAGSRSPSRGAVSRSPSRWAGNRSRSQLIGAGRRSTPRLTMNKEDMDDLAEGIVKKVFVLKEEKEARLKQDSTRKEVWEEGSDFLVCKFCSKNKVQQNLPHEILRFKRGNFGMISRNRENVEKISEFEVRRRMRDHEEGNFHLWCMRKTEEEKQISKSFEEKNNEAGLLMIKAYLQTVSVGRSADDFLRLVNFTHLIPDVMKSQKNNSRNTFFELRDDCFEVVTNRVHNIFKSDQITELSAILDKVTVQSRSYTVLLTFFFVNGKIYCLLNSLLKMGEDDYEIAGTARMVVAEMRKTLGITRTQLAKKLLHFRSSYYLVSVVDILFPNVKNLTLLGTVYWTCNE